MYIYVSTYIYIDRALQTQSTTNLAMAINGRDTNKQVLRP